MKILLIAPHPFFQERGTPIAVDLLLQALSARGYDIDVLTYHEGEDRQYPGVRIIRSLSLGFVNDIPPGPSWKKIVCDVFVTLSALKLAWQNKYDVVHAVEEAAFIAVVLKLLFRTPMVYDMDSSMATQLIDKFPALGRVGGLIRGFERLPIRQAEVVVPVCDDLAEVARSGGAKEVVLLKDVSLRTESSTPPDINIHAEYPVHGPVAMYIGNLESYQGIDLLIDAFSLAVKRCPDAWLFIIGGSDADISHYRSLVAERSIPNLVLLGRQPVAQIADFMSQATVLASPRTQGQNTPMKLYSYMDSGRAIVATDIQSHTQVLNDANARLSAPQPEPYADALVELFEDEGLREDLAQQAKNLVEQEHTIDAFNRSAHQLYDLVERRSAQ